MQAINTHKSCSGTRRHYHFVFPEEPHLQSLAALVLIKNQYMLLDPEANPHINWKIYKRRKAQVLKENFAKYGKYVCAYCKRDDLRIDVIQKNPCKATIDHIIPISRGGSFTDKKNMVVSCAKCNNDKGNLSENDFLCRLYSLSDITLS